VYLERHVDDRGSLYEVIHNYDLPASNNLSVAPFGQVYVVQSPARWTIRAFHRHKQLWDWFTVVRGRAKIVVVKASSSAAPADRIWTFTLCQEKPARLEIPPGLFHGWQALTDDVIMLSVASHVYNREHPDEERITPYAFGVRVWGIQDR